MWQLMGDVAVATVCVFAFLFVVLVISLVWCCWAEPRAAKRKGQRCRTCGWWYHLKLTKNGFGTCTCRKAELGDTPPFYGGKCKRWLPREDVVKETDRWECWEKAYDAQKNQTMRVRVEAAFSAWLDSPTYQGGEELRDIVMKLIREGGEKDG